jgi:hypothetical protein
LEDGERVESYDDLVRGVSPQFSKCPSSIGTLVEYEAMQQRTRSWHETVNKRLKQWKLLKIIYKGKIEHHGSYFCVAATVTQLNINYGECLFDVEYEDIMIPIITSMNQMRNPMMITNNNKAYPHWIVIVWSLAS